MWFSTYILITFSVCLNTFFQACTFKYFQYLDFFSKLIFYKIRNVAYISHTFFLFCRFLNNMLYWFRRYIYSIDFAFTRLPMIYEWKTVVHLFFFEKWTRIAHILFSSQALKIWFCKMCKCLNQRRFTLRPIFRLQFPWILITELLFLNLKHYFIHISQKINTDSQSNHFLNFYNPKWMKAIPVHFSKENKRIRCPYNKVWWS